MSDKNLEVEMRGDTPYVNGVALASYTLTSAQLLVGSSANVPTARTVTGDVTISNTGVTTIATGAVEDSMIEGLAAGQIILGVDGTAANNLKAVLSGDVTMDGTGAVTIAAEAVTPAKTSGVAVLYNLGTPVVADVDRIVTTTNMIVGAYTVAAQPDVPRNITVTATAVGAADTMGTVTIAGTNYADEAITEELTPAAGSTVAGTKAFKTVTTVTGAGWVINEGNDTITVGVGTEIGCHVTADAATDIMLGILGVTVTAHNPTVSDPVTLEGSTVDMSAGTYDGSKAVLVFQKN